MKGALPAAENSTASSIWSKNVSMGKLTSLGILILDVFALRPAALILV